MVGFLTEVKTTLEDFLSNLLDVLELTMPKAEIVSSATELAEEKKEFLAGYPWDDHDEHSFSLTLGMVSCGFNLKRHESHRSKFIKSVTQ